MYGQIWQFHDGRARVYQDGKQGFVDKTGQVSIALKYDDARDFSDGLAMVEQNGKVGYINPQGKVIIPLMYEPTQSEFGNNFLNGFVEASLAGKQGIIDKQNNVIIPFIYDNIYKLSDEANNVFFQVELNDKEGLLDSTGKIIIPIEYDRVGWISEGLIAVGNLKDSDTNTDAVNNDKNNAYSKAGFGYFNSSGELVIPFNYDYAQAFIGGLAVVKKDNKSGLINHQGDIVIPIEYQRLEQGYLAFAHADAIPVSKDEFSDVFLIDKQGNRVSDNYDNIEPFYGKLAAAYHQYDDDYSLNKTIEAVLLNDRGEVVRRAAAKNFFLHIKNGKLQGYFIEVQNDLTQQGAILIDPDGQVVGLMPDFVLPSV